MKFIIALCALGVIFLASTGADRALAGGLEYDQITFLNTDVAAHPPGSFDRDLTAIKAAALNGELGTVASRKRVAELLKEAKDPARQAALLAAGQIPVIGTLGVMIALNALTAKMKKEGAAMSSSMADAFRTEQRLGKWYHVVYLNGWTRREDVANQTVLIVKPDSNERIYLDLAMQTYYTTPATDSPQSQASMRATLCAPSTTLDRGPQVIDGISTEIFQTTFNASQATATMTRYESSFTEPPKRTAVGELIPLDCPAGTAHTGPPMLTDRVALYQTMSADYGKSVVSTLEETGNIKQADEDRALFEVPPGFKEKRPGDWRA